NEPNLEAYAEAGLANPTVTSDKDDYAPGETAIITGTGWTLDSIVDIHLEEDPAHDHHHGYHDTPVNSLGNWRIEYPIEERHLGVAFTVVVDGKHSGYQGLTFFTDAQTTVTTISSNNNPSEEGEEVILTISVTRDNQGQQRNTVEGTLNLAIN